jgi:hypothetical protein
MLIGKASPEDTSLHPIKYKWAYDLYNQAVRNTWFPHEITLKEDMDDWKKMTDDERHAVTFLMAFFNPAELIVNRSIALGIYPYLKSPECHLYLAKQMWEEANHCVAFDIYDITTNRWDITPFFGPQTETLTTGSMYTYDGGDTLYFTRDATGRIFALNLNTFTVNACTTSPYTHGTALIGNRMEIIQTEDDLQYIYVMRHSGQEFWRTLKFW